MEFCKNWWWVFLFCALTSVFHLQAMRNKKGLIQTYQDQLTQMENDKDLALSQKKELELKINSATDPAWIEMMLIRDLGVVPEGYLKVHFKK